MNSQSDDYRKVADRKDGRNDFYYNKFKEV